VSIDPTTQKVGAPVSIGANPRRLAISSDGQFLYVGLDGANAVQQFKLKSHTLGNLVTLPADPIFGSPTTAGDIRVVPNAPADYVVSLTRQFVSPPEAGTALIANGSFQSVLSNSYPQNVSVDNIRFLASPTTFYGSDGFTFFQFEITNNSALSVVASSFAPQGLGLFESDGKYLYGSGGIVFDPIANQIVGTYQFPIPGEFNPAVLPDSSVQRTYFLTNGSTLLAFDQTTFNLVGSLNLPPNTFDPFRLVRWGRDGFAFLNFNFSTGASDVILLRSHLAIR
jgi:DNA-binding beta-propeller fold protein YncE